MFIQVIYDISCFLNSVLHIATDWMLGIPVLKYLAVALNWVFDGLKTVQYHLLFSDLINLQPNPNEYSVWHYRVNYGLHFLFALIFYLIVLFGIIFLITEIESRIEAKKIRKLEKALNDRLHEVGSKAVYQCRYEDWKYVMSYDESPFEEACKYMRNTIAELEWFVSSGGNAQDISTVEDIYSLNRCLKENS